MLISYLHSADNIEMKCYDMKVMLGSFDLNGYILGLNYRQDRSKNLFAQHCKQCRIKVLLSTSLLGHTLGFHQED